MNLLVPFVGVWRGNARAEAICTICCSESRHAHIAATINTPIPMTKRAR